MCGRFTVKSNLREVAKAFDLSEVPEAAPRYNISPTQQVLCVLGDADGGRRRLVSYRWGLVPSWADDPKIGSKMINARAETVDEKPSFRRALRSRRCLIVADGFYEWKKTDDGKVPHYITLADERPFGFAGLYEHWTRGDQSLDTCTIITTEANELLRALHDRMPVIVRPELYDLWLDNRIEEPAKLTPALLPYPAAAMKYRPVSPQFLKSGDTTGQVQKSLLD